jgi:hypothetical protein
MVGEDVTVMKRLPTLSEKAGDSSELAKTPLRVNNYSKLYCAIPPFRSRGKISN